MPQGQTLAGEGIGRHDQLFCVRRVVYRSLHRPFTTPNGLALGRLYVFFKTKALLAYLRVRLLLAALATATRCCSPPESSLGL